jgi:hypothetical protein
MSQFSETGKDICKRLFQKMVASCECMTKTPNPEYHKPDCLYRVLSDASVFIARMVRNDELMEKLKLGWECATSPTGYCVYNEEIDPASDDCVYCHQPEERK